MLITDRGNQVILFSERVGRRTPVTGENDPPRRTDERCKEMDDRAQGMQAEVLCMHSVRQRREVAPIMTQHAAFPSTGGEISGTCTRRTQISVMPHLHIHKAVFLHFVRLP